MSIKSTGRTFMFVDDNIIADRVFAVQLFERMAGLKKRWVSQCSIKISEDEKLLKLAAKAGCVGLFIGIESVNKANLDRMDKSFNDPDSYVDKIKTINRAGIGVQAGMIVGLDSDDTSVFKRNLNFLQKANVGALQLAILTPHPGTPLREEFERQGRIIDHNWNHYDYRHTVIKPKQMTSQQLQDGADWLYSQYYRFDRVLLRVVKAFFKTGFFPALLCWRLNRTYRYDIRRLKIKGRNPESLLSRFKTVFSGWPVRVV